VQLRRAEAEDSGAIRDLVTSCGLPTDGVPDDAELFVVAHHAGGVIAVAGLELHEGDGLLRSVATAASLRGRGVASRLCDEIEQRACSLGARQLFLLTQTAEQFFAKRGYRCVERAAAPCGIASSREFTTLCPASSVLMVLDLQSKAASASRSASSSGRAAPARPSR